MPTPRSGPCAVTGCPGRGNFRGLCKKHWYRSKANGDPLVTRPAGAPAGEDHPLYRGDRISYTAAHMRTRRWRGRASSHGCVHCGLAARHWALRHDRPSLLDAEMGLRYSGNPDDYVPLCVPCHSAYDRGQIELTLEPAEAPESAAASCRP